MNFSPWYCKVKIENSLSFLSKISVHMFLPVGIVLRRWPWSRGYFLLSSEPQNNILSHYFILLPFALKTHLSLTLGMSLLSCHCSYSSYVAFFYIPSQPEWAIAIFVGLFWSPSAHSVAGTQKCFVSECVLCKWERGRECPPTVISGPVCKDK